MIVQELEIVVKKHLWLIKEERLVPLETQISSNTIRMKEEKVAIASRNLEKENFLNIVIVRNLVM